jgi:formyl-CoA transferase
LNDEIGKITRTKTSAEWIEILNEASVPCGPIYTIDQTMADPQVEHLGIAKPIKHPRLGDELVVGQAMSLSAAGGRPNVRLPAPDPGEHTEEVLASIGYDATAVAKLREQRVV